MTTSAKTRFRNSLSTTALLACVGLTACGAADGMDDSIDPNPDQTASNDDGPTGTANLAYMVCDDGTRAQPTKVSHCIEQGDYLADVAASIKKCLADGEVVCQHLEVLVPVKVPLGGHGVGIECRKAMKELICKPSLRPCLKYEVNSSWCCGESCGPRMVESDGTYDPKGRYGFDEVSPTPPDPPAPTARTGTVNVGSSGLNVRSCPKTTCSPVGKVYNGQKVTISCQAYGTQVTGGPYGTSKIWDFIGTGYVSDAYVSTGGAGLFAPLCR